MGLHAGETCLAAAQLLQPVAWQPLQTTLAWRLEPQSHAPNSGTPFVTNSAMTLAMSAISSAGCGRVVVGILNLIDTFLSSFV